MARIIELPTFCDSRGELSVLEQAVPFSIRRVYFIRRAKGLRGGHRHRANVQVLVAVAGSVRIHVDDGERRTDYVLDDPRRALLVECRDWHTMDDFSPDCVLLVLASEPYDVADYIDQPYPD